MALQSQVYIEQALGKAGTISRLNPIVKEPMIAEGSDVLAGGFVYAGTNPEMQVVGKKADAVAVEGFAVLGRYQLNRNGFASSMLVNEGEEIAVVKKGYCYALATTAASRGQHVVVNPSTGEIQTASIVASAGTGAVTGTITITDGSIEVSEGAIDVTQGTISGTVDGTDVTGTTSGVAASQSGTTASQSGSSASFDLSANIGSVSGIPAGFIDTGWVVVTGASANEVCEIACI